MNDHGVFTGSDTIRFERLFPGPIERIWTYLTDSEKRGTWLASGPMELKVGGAVKLHFDHALLSPTKEPTPERFREKEGGLAVQGRITRCEPPRLLAMTWALVTKDASPNEDSEVTFELAPRGDKVRLLLTLRRLTDRGTLLKVAGGWHTHLAILGDNLEGRVPRPFWSNHEKLVRDYEERLKSA